MKPLKLFLLLTFALFFIGFAITGGLLAFGAPDNLIVIVQILMAWTPTMAYVIVHRRIDPSRSLWRQIADLFTTRIRLLPLLASLLIPVVATVLVGIGYAWFTDQPLLDLVARLSLPALLLMFTDTLIRGPLGEELGWRGYLQNEMNKRHSLLKASLIVGVIWAVWHLPLWFVSGYQGVDLLLYILFFAAGLIAFSVIIGFVYDRGRNLLYPILLHQMLNFSGRLLNAPDLVVLGGSSAVYVIMAGVIALVWLRSSPRPMEVQPAGPIAKSA